MPVHIIVAIIFTFYICKNWQVCPELQKNQHSLFSPAFFLFEFQLVSKAPTKVTLDSNGESKGAPFWALCPFMTFFKVNLWIGVPGAHSLYTWPQKNMPAPSTAQSGHQPHAEAGQAQDPAQPRDVLKVPQRSWVSTGTTHTALPLPSQDPVQSCFLCLGW